MENAERLALALESCQVAAFALAGGDRHLADLALEDAVKVLQLVEAGGEFASCGESGPARSA